MSAAVVGVSPSRLLLPRQEQRLPVLHGKRVEELAPSDFLGSMNEVEVRNAPKTIFAAGDISLLKSGRRVSVVGSRKAAPEDLERARRLVGELVSRCVTVVSGLAAGIDTAAHRKALEMRGRTLAVLATPLDRTYPKSNIELQEQIVSSDLAISQYAFGTKVRRENFVSRNRTMALLCDATIIVAADETSGTQHQGWEAIRLGRPLFFLDHLLDRNVSWIREQMQYGADSLGPENLDLFFEHLPERGAFESFAF